MPGAADDRADGPHRPHTPPVSATPAASGDARVPLFPLQTVLYPGGLLQLKVFEARYLDLVAHCLRTQQPFGVVCLRQGTEVQHPDAPAAHLEAVAVQAHLLEVDAEQAGILRVRCQGGLRLALAAPAQDSGGLWRAMADPLPADDVCPVPTELQPCADALAQAMDALARQNQHPFLTPHRFSDAGWVANRWCEVLPISLAAKQRLMVLDEPLLRLKLVDDYLRGKGVIGPQA